MAISATLVTDIDSLLKLGYITQALISTKDKGGYISDIEWTCNRTYTEITEYLIFKKMNQPQLKSHN